MRGEIQIVAMNRGELSPTLNCDLLYRVAGEQGVLGGRGDTGEAS